MCHWHTSHNNNCTQKQSFIFSLNEDDQEKIPSTVLFTHRWTQEDTDRRSCPLGPHRWRRSRRALRHTHSRQFGSGRPGNPARRSTSSRPRVLCIWRCFGTGSESTGPLWRAARQERHLDHEIMDTMWKLFTLWTEIIGCKKNRILKMKCRGALSWESTLY